MLDAVQEICWPLSLLLLGIWAIQLVRAGLARRYPILLSYLATACLTGAGGYVVHHLVAARLLGRSSYFWYWATAQPLLGLLLFAVFFESFSRMAEQYEGVRRLARPVIYALAAGSVLILGFFLLTHSFETPETRYWTAILLIQQQSVYFTSAGLVLLLLGIRRFFALPVPRNVSVTVGALGVYVVSIASLTAIRSYIGHRFHEFDAAVDVVGLGIYCSCLLFGAVAFSKSGEAVARDRRFDLPAQETLEVAAGRLQHVNEQLLKVVVR